MSIDFCPPSKDLVIDLNEFDIEKYFVSTNIVEVKNPIKEGETESSGSYQTSEYLYTYDTPNGPVRAPLRIRVHKLRARRGITSKIANGKRKEYCLYNLNKNDANQAKFMDVNCQVYNKTCTTLYCKKVQKVLDVGFDAEKPLDLKALNDPKKRWACLWHPLMYDKDKTKITPESTPVFIGYLMKGSKKTNFLKATTSCVPCKGAECHNDKHTRLPVHFPPTQVRKIGFTGTAVFLYRDLYFGGKCNKFRIDLETMIIVDPEIITASTTETATIREMETSGLVDSNAYEEKMRLMEEANGSSPDTAPPPTATVNSKNESASEEDDEPVTPPPKEKKSVISPKPKAKAKPKQVAPATDIDEFDDNE